MAKRVVRRRSGEHLEKPINDMRRESEQSANYKVYSGGTIIYLDVTSYSNISYYRGSALVTAGQNCKHHTMSFDLEVYKKAKQLDYFTTDIQDQVEALHSEHINNQMREIMSAVSEEVKRIH
ncbi:MAG: hypothetical protein LKF48_07365 [Prevotella sp.]|jgi:hypothetical protein|nr:hypothetical protein [Prevotella sp.]MCH4182957.1 hypothetical protein [Prevotella sp.]